jgi:membrane fusion protein (multidrug efflux system)
MIKRTVLTLIVAIAVFGAIFGYRAQKDHKAKTAAAGRRPPPATVTAQPAATETWRSSLNAVGNLESFHGITVRTEIEGRIAQVPFESGAAVQAGDVLLELDSATETAQLKGLEARARLAEVTLERARELRKNNTNPQSELDAAEAAHAQALAAVDELKATLAKKRIVAPFAGRLGIRLINPGQFLNKGDAVVALEAVDPIYVDFGVPQQDITQVKPGLVVTLSLDAFPGRQFTGKIEAISPRVTQETRNVRVRGVVENKDEALRAGMFARVEVQLPEERSVLVLPTTAVVYSTYGDSVYVVADEKLPNAEKPQLVARQVPVQVGAKRGDQVSILQGIKAGDTVVTSGQVKLRNGSPVQINNAVIPPNNPAPKPAES